MKLKGRCHQEAANGHPQDISKTKGYVIYGSGKASMLLWHYADHGYCDGRIKDSVGNSPQGDEERWEPPVRIRSEETADQKGEEQKSNAESCGQARAEPISQMTAEGREYYGQNGWGYKQDSNKGRRMSKNVLKVKWQKKRGESITHGYDEKA